ncbi:hypothetical protein GCM10009850_098700 [Nonomuraea monospora]|uniref:DUF1772 domain-containing protein n=1 Tax=Nonomuraea monospora TaxID=568818 RepID=A0ABN3CXZ7_9ACTN
MIATLALWLSVVAAGLWSGLLLTLTTILHPMFVRQPGRGFATECAHFLPIARRSPTNYALVILLIVAPAVALLGLREAPSGVPFVLTAAGLVATVTTWLISLLRSEPNYDVILSWDPDALPNDWQQAQRRWIRLNWTRAALTWTAFALFVLATHAHLTT